MTQILPYIQIVSSLLLVGAILLQRSEASLGAAFGADSGFGGRFVRRGFEKLLFNVTVVIAIIFLLSVLVSLFVR